MHSSSATEENITLIWKLVALSTVLYHLQQFAKVSNYEFAQKSIV